MKKIKFYLFASIYLLSFKTSEAKQTIKVKDSLVDKKEFSVEIAPSETIKDVLLLLKTDNDFSLKRFEGGNFTFLLGDLDLTQPLSL